MRAARRLRDFDAPHRLWPPGASEQLGTDGDPPTGQRLDDIAHGRILER